MKPFHYVVLGFTSVVAAKIIKGLLSGWLNFNF